MAMRTQLPVVVAAIAVALAASPLVVSQPVTILGGQTTVTLSPGVPEFFLSNGIIPVIMLPGKDGFRFYPTDDGGAGLEINGTFPVTGGFGTLEPLSGKIYHSGGIRFYNANNRKSIEVVGYTIDASTGQMTGRIRGTTSRGPIFTLNLSGATVDTSMSDRLRFYNVGLDLTAVAADVMNNALGVTIFESGQTFGTAMLIIHI